MYMNAPRFSKQSLYLLLRKATHLIKLWHELECARITKSDELTEKEVAYEQVHVAYLRLEDLVSRVERFDQPHAKFFSNFRAILAYVLSGDEAALTGRPREDWVTLHGLPRMDSFVHNSVEYSTVEFALQMLAKKTKTEDGSVAVIYSVSSLAKVLGALKNCAMATLLGVPVALQALNVTTPGASVGIYLTALLVFCILVQICYEDHKMQTVLTLGYAAVLVANMSPK
ncbi:hypothetical protein F66182_3033 [Fusarium sp. NRRL 66182]|nr:hypothetical protein F66182_3033 [Fusarium sp. NRRL 66182]